MTGSSDDVAAALSEIDGRIREAIVVIDEPGNAPDAESDIFAEKEPFVVHRSDVDESREASSPPVSFG